MGQSIIYFLQYFFVQILMYIVVSHKVQLVSAVLCTFLQILETKLHHQITVAFETFVPNDPQVLLNRLPLRILWVVFLLIRFRCNGWFSQLNDFSVGDVIFETFILDWSNVPEIFVYFVFGPVSEQENVEEGVFHEELRRCQLGSKMLWEVSHDVVIEFMNKSELTSKLYQIIYLNLRQKRIHLPSNTHIMSKFVCSYISIHSYKAEAVDC